MVILIGGSSHVGKTLLSQKLMERLKIPYCSLDHLKMGLIRSGMTDWDVCDDVTIRYAMWPFVAEIIKTAIENRQNLILEGCYIPEEWADSFSDEYRKDIRCVFLVMSERYLRTHFDAVKAYSNVIETRMEDDLDLERLIRCSRGFREACMERQIPFVEIDGEYDTERILEQIISLTRTEPTWQNE